MKKKWAKLLTLVFLLSCCVPNLVNVLASNQERWEFEEIIFDSKQMNKLGEVVNISIDMKGDTSGVKYKFLWKTKGSWEEWGVIQQTSAKKTATWTPGKVGKYEIVVDIIDGKNVQTKIKEYDVLCHVWKFDKIIIDRPSPQEKYTTPIKLEVVNSGEIENIRYKYVWEKDNWKNWGVLKSFSKENFVDWVPKEVGKYTILVDMECDGEVTTKSLQYEIIPVNWKIGGMDFLSKIPNKKGENVKITTNIIGNTKGLQYKYVWMKDNWKKWGTIRNFSLDSTSAWCPKESGKYTIFTDVLGRDGEILKTNANYEVFSNIWKHEGVSVNNNISEQIYTRLPILATTSGENEGLEYKFVWKKGKENEEWGEKGKDWDELGKYSKMNYVEWYPKEPGTYTIFSDVRDNDGRIITRTCEYTVLDTPWQVDEIVSREGEWKKKGEEFDISVLTSGEGSENLKYKFVWKKGEHDESWGKEGKDWGVLQGFSKSNSIKFLPSIEDDYTIFVDVMDDRGVIYDAKYCEVHVYKFKGVTANPQKISYGNSSRITAVIEGPNSLEGLDFKFVWKQGTPTSSWGEEKKNWGVLRNFSSNSFMDWKPGGPGTLTVFVDVKQKGEEKVETHSVTFEVTNKNGWYYEGGYKFYYKNGEKLLDLDGVLGRQSSYYIMVNRKMCTVTVYAKDGNNGYIIPVKRFACSVGKSNTPTPVGTFYTPSKYRWHTLMGPSYGQYCTRITGSILFHSVAGKNMTSYNLDARDYNMLGQPASHGCVRLCVRDAKWIYDNCSLKTKVTIYDSNVSGPLGKPVTIKIPLNQTWDPTDPNVK